MSKKTKPRSQELNREIGGIFGYKVYKQSDPRSDFWDLSYPDGSIRRNYADEQAAWQATPNWQANAEAALALVITLPFHLQPSHPDFIKGGKPPFECSINAGDDTFWIGYGKTPAEAICEAWLMWRAANK